MSQHRMDYLVGDHQSRLQREAVDERLAQVARDARRSSDVDRAAHGSLPSLGSLWHDIRRLRVHQQPRLHPRS